MEKVNTKLDMFNILEWQKIEEKIQLHERTKMKNSEHYFNANWILIHSVSSHGGIFVPAFHQTIFSIISVIFN